MAKAAPARRRPELAPLEPERFLAWAWRSGPRRRGSGPLTVDDLWFAWVPGVPELTNEDVRRLVVGLAARVRRNQRLGPDPWGGV